MVLVLLTWMQKSKFYSLTVAINRSYNAAETFMLPANKSLFPFLWWFSTMATDMQFNWFWLLNIRLVLWSYMIMIRSQLTNQTARYLILRQACLQKKRSTGLYCGISKLSSLSLQPVVRRLEQRKKGKIGGRYLFLQYQKSGQNKTWQFLYILDMPGQISCNGLSLCQCLCQVKEKHSFWKGIFFSQV